MTQAVRILYAGPRPTGPLLKTLKYLLPEMEIVPCHDGYESCNVGFLVAFNRQDFYEGLAQLLSHKCKRIAVFPALKDTWGTVNGPLRWFVEEAIEKVCSLKELDLHKMCSWLAAGNCMEDPLIRTKLLQFAQATNLFHLISNFSHGGPSDITNQFLAPFRLLLEAQEFDIARTFITGLDKKIQTKFHEDVHFPVTRSPSLYGELGTELIKVFASLCEKLKVGISNCVQSDVEHLMQVLTEIRKVSGCEPCPGRRTNSLQMQPIVAGLEDNDAVVRILVVDDHADAWKEVLRLLATRLSNDQKCRVEIEVSFDCQSVWLKDYNSPDKLISVPLLQYLAEYDMVLLDIYIDGYPQGLGLLKSIRERMQSLPVIIWTTSSDADLPAEATAANGFLFKKRCSLEMMFNSIKNLMSSGKSRRMYSLPNPFFDHIIQVPALRSLAVDFTKWCLKMVDSFHALDDSYFKHFNDHGGRHIISLLSILERIIRPMLFKGSPIFSDDIVTREQEILSLYLTAFCHELGMFPHDQEDKFSRMTGAKLASIRKLHAVRGLILLNDKSRQWPEFRSLLERLPSNVHITLCLVTCYHSQILTLDNQDDFCIVTDETRTLLKMLLPNDEAPFAKALEDLKQKLVVLCTKDRDFLLRVRRMCSVFRFSDALDIDKTRVPADFLLHDESRSSQNDRENLKRQIVETVTIERGVINVSLNASPIYHEQIADFIEKYDRKNLEPDLNRMKWENLWEDKDCCDALKRIGRPLNLMLEMYFRNPDISKTGVVTLLASVSVAFEILEEYTVIIGSGLATFLKLGKFQLCKAILDPPSIMTEGNLCPSPSVVLIQNDTTSLAKQDRCAIDAALGDLLWATRRGVLPETEIKQLRAGYSGAFACIIRPKGFQPRFCKVDSHERIATEYRGLKSYASVYIPPENLLADVRICKFRDRGVLLGALVADAEMLQYSICKGTIYPSDIGILFNDVLMACGTCLGKMSLREAYSSYMNDGRDNLASKLKHLSEDQEVWPSNWKKLGINAINELNVKAEHPLSKSFKHGDFQARNVLYLPNLGYRSSRQFIIIDTFDCGLGHALDDLASFWVNLNTRVADDSANGDNTSSLCHCQKNLYPLNKAAIDAVKKKLLIDEDAFRREFALARLIHLLNMLTGWPNQFSKHRVNQVVTWAWNEVDKAQKELCNS